MYVEVFFTICLTQKLGYGKTASLFECLFFLRSLYLGTVDVPFGAEQVDDDDVEGDMRDEEGVSGCMPGWV